MKISTTSLSISTCLEALDAFIFYFQLKHPRTGKYFFINYLVQKYSMKLQNPKVPPQLLCRDTIRSQIKTFLPSHSGLRIHKVPKL